MDHDKRIHNVQHLRGFAALIVVMHHCFWTAREYDMFPVMQTLFRSWGGSGVDIFFVISGFIMVTIQSRKHRDGVEFFVNRIIRIVPIYWFLTLLLAGMITFLPFLFRSHTAEPMHLLTSLFFLSTFVNGHAPVINMGWTLEYEFLFYSVFALTLWLKNAITSALATAVVMVMLVVFGGYSVILEFVYGMAVAALIIRAPGLSKFWPLVGLVGVLTYLASIGIKFPDGMRAVYWGLPATLIVYAAVAGPQIRSRSVGFIGNASYSIYLIQIFTIPPLFKLVTALGITSISTDLLCLIAFIGTVIAGSLFYLLFEKPVTKFLSDRYRVKKSDAKAAAAT